MGTLRAAKAALLSLRFVSHRASVMADRNSRDDPAPGGSSNTRADVSGSPKKTAAHIPTQQTQCHALQLGGLGAVTLCGTRAGKSEYGFVAAWVEYPRVAKLSIGTVSIARASQSLPQRDPGRTRGAC